MVYWSDSEDLERDNDGEVFRYDNTIPTAEEKYDDLINELRHTLRSKFVSGIHSSIIVPSGAGGVRKCLRELDQLINRYPPNHFFIVSEHGDHVHLSYICPYSGRTCRCSFLVRGTFWSRYVNFVGLLKSSSSKQTIGDTYCDTYLRAAEYYVHR
eukprot:XP_016663484.1 PREDICTED: uncharacterized protein LOC107884906 isoform X1 [Acyrthosiphon pisum]